MESVSLKLTYTILPEQPICFRVLNIDKRSTPIMIDTTMKSQKCHHELVLRGKCCESILEIVLESYRYVKVLGRLYHRYQPGENFQT
jgi:hypothetical protein